MEQVINGVKLEVGPYVDLTEANLRGADLTEVDLTEANLRGADLTGANLTEANLCRANLCKANLCRANLTEVNLYRANLCRANLTEVNLYRANLTEVNLTEVNLTGTRYVVGPQRRDGYRFDWDGEKVRAGCRHFTFEEFRRHVAAEYPGTPKAAETLAILSYLEERSKAL